MTYADAKPTKRFFTDMLTRDIDLADAILDLVDNSIDGIARYSVGDVDYSSYEINIDFNEEGFVILDNCGGIPREIAEKYAFRFGRPVDYPQPPNESRTVGIYGIGMKRAIFKIGNTAEVLTDNDGKSYKVTITSDWMADDAAWAFPIEDVTSTDIASGTKISVTDLEQGVASQFSNKKFTTDLREQISVTYAVMLNKGLVINTNSQRVVGKSIKLLFREDMSGASPYLYRAQYDGVTVELAVGFYTLPPSDEDQEREIDQARISDNAGWTIICNDRVVVYNDKTRLTGWGEASVPNFHTQFINIAGVVIFHSDDTEKLPLTTTKRGVDTSSELYLKVKDYMRLGLKKFTSFTNDWKREEDKGATQLARAIPLSITEFFQSDRAQTIPWTNVRNSRGEQKLDQPLPKPQAANDNQWIKFRKPRNEVEALRKEYYDDVAATPSQVGEEAFDTEYKRLPKGVRR